jgi:predicted esterase
MFFCCLSFKAQGTVRYQSEIFSGYHLQSNIQYGQAITAEGATIKLMLDVYTGVNDTTQNRPLVMFIHGGGFQNGDKVSNYGKRVCSGLAKRGYVVASINYRLSPGLLIIDSTKYFEALYRAIQDGKAAVRFFRKHALTYGVDTTQIFVIGSSAGAKVALHMAYLDQIEVPSFINTTKLGTLEGSSGNPGYSSNVKGVINCWGAIWDLKWIQPKDAPVYCVHGIYDIIVPYDSSYSYKGFKYGSLNIFNRANELGIPSGLRLFQNTGHTLDNNSAKQDSAIKDFSDWLFNIYNNSISASLGDNTRSVNPSLLIDVYNKIINVLKNDKIF